MVDKPPPAAQPAAHPADAEPLPELGDRICAGAVRLAAATAAWLLMVAEFDEREGWRGVGIASCAHWLAWRCALTPGTARQHVRVARAMQRLPLIATAFASGELSYSKVRALTRVAEPGTEEELVEFARHATASQVERTVRAWRRADDVDAGRVRDRRRFSWWTEDDGMISIQLRMEPEAGAEFLASIESLAERDARRDRAARKRSLEEGDEAYQGDETDQVVPLPVTTERRCRALTQLAAAAADAGRRAGDPPRREVVVVVDAAVLADDEAGGRAHLEGGPALSQAQARRLACDASVTAIVTDGAEVLAQGRARRYATRAQRRALLMRRPPCRGPARAREGWGAGGSC